MSDHPTMDLTLHALPEEARRHEGEINRLLGTGTLEIRNETGEEVVVKVEEATADPEGEDKTEVWRSLSREAVLEGLRAMHAEFRHAFPDEAEPRLAAAIAYLRTDPAEPWRALAARMWAAVSAAWNAAAAATHDCSLRSDVLALTKDSALLLWDDPRTDLVAEAERWLAEQVKTRAEALADDYAIRMEAVADLWDEEGKTTIGNHARACHGRAHGLREAAHMLRDKEGR